MKRISQTELLDIKILELKRQRELEFYELKNQFKIVKNSLSTPNLVREGLTGIYKTSFNKGAVFSFLKSIIGDYISNKVEAENNQNEFKNILKSVLEFSITNIIYKFFKNRNEKNA